MSNKSKVEITELVLQMGPTKVSMSLEDAEKVFKVLEKLFGQKVEYYPVYQPRRWWYYDGLNPYVTWGTNTVGSSGLDLQDSNHFNDSPKFEISKIADAAVVKNGQLTLSMNNVSANFLA